MSHDSVRHSKRLSWLLRHGAGQSNLAMDEAGWASIDDVLGVLKMNREDLGRAVEQNDKGRLVVEGDRIRACQGHSLADMPVTVEGLEASWEVVHPSNSLWHGTRSSALKGIAEAGILPGARSHVHLAPHPDSSVGKRSSVDVFVEVAPDHLASSGLHVYRAPNGVILVRTVPTNAIVGLRPISKAGHQAVGHVRDEWPSPLR